MFKITILVSLFSSSVLIASVMGASDPDATADLNQDKQKVDSAPRPANALPYSSPSLPDHLAVLCLQFAFYDWEVHRKLSPELIALCASYQPGFPSEPGVLVTGAGQDSMNGWYRRMEIDAEPPASALRSDEEPPVSWLSPRRTREDWYEDIKDSPGWYHSANGSYIYWNSGWRTWFMRDEDGLLMYEYMYDHKSYEDYLTKKYTDATAPDFPPRDGWEVFNGEYLSALTVPVVVDADGCNVRHE